jgi:hypothetical protein
MRRILVLALVVIPYSVSVAQNCAQVLRLARSTYDQGRLHELPSLMKDCLDSKKTDSFSKPEKVEAYKLLTLSYIYLEEPEKADSSMLLLLKADPYFSPNEKVDPQEFLGLYKTFRTEPVYRVGLKVGANATQPNVISSAFPNGGTSKYDYKIGVLVGASIEIPVLKKFVLNPELYFISRTFSLTNTISPLATTSPETQSWVSMPVSLQYEFMKEKFKKGDQRIMPYVALGAQFDYLLSSSESPSTERTGFASITQQTFVTKSNRSTTNLSAILSVGAKMKAGPGLLIAEARFSYGLTPITNSKDVYANQQLIFNNNVAPSIYSLNSLSVTIGYGYNIFKPKKLKKKVRKVTKKDRLSIGR